MPLRNTDKTTRNRNKKNLSKLVVLPALELCWRSCCCAGLHRRQVCGHQQRGACRPAVTRCQTLPAPARLGRSVWPHALCNVSVQYFIFHSADLGCINGLGVLIWGRVDQREWGIRKWRALRKEPHLLQQSSKGDPGRSLLLELRGRTSREHGRSWETQGKAGKSLREASWGWRCG